jgi:hypothetical protein
MEASPSGVTHIKQSTQAKEPHPMTRTKRLLFIVAAITLLATAFPIAASAQSEEPPPTRDRAAVDAEGSGERLRFAKQRVIRQIERRLAALDRLDATVESARHLSANHAAALLDAYAGAEAILTAGIDAVNAVETIADLRKIAPPIFEDTLVFALAKPKTVIVIASDTIATADDRYADAATRLQDALDRLAEEGIDVSEAQADLDEALSLTASAAAAAAPVAEAVIGLQPGDEIEGPLKAAKETLAGTRRQLGEAKSLTRGIIRFIRSNSSGGEGR